MLKGTRPWIDGTMGGPDHLMELLAFHLHRLGAARAKAVTFVSDGAPWIWNRLDWVIGRAGLDPKRVERILDCYHAAHHVSLALQALGLPEAQRTATYRTLRHQLRAGRSREVVAALRRLAQARPSTRGCGPRSSTSISTRPTCATTGSGIAGTRRAAGRSRARSGG